MTQQYRLQEVMIPNFELYSCTYSTKYIKIAFMALYVLKIIKINAVFWEMNCKQIAVKLRGTPERIIVRQTCKSRGLNSKNTGLSFFGRKENRPKTVSKV